jgi:hypothetical protein
MISERITPEGRAAVRHNLLKHGLTACEIVLRTVVAGAQLALIVQNTSRLSQASARGLSVAALES